LPAGRSSGIGIGAGGRHLELLQGIKRDAQCPLKSRAQRLIVVVDSVERNVGLIGTGSIDRAAATVGGAADESKVCRSPVAGIVVRVSVQPGQQLQINELIVVLEAMKMETSVVAPIAGKVKSVKVGSGDAVKLHQILVEFE